MTPKKSATRATISVILLLCLSVSCRTPQEPGSGVESPSATATVVAPTSLAKPVVVAPTSASSSPIPTLALTNVPPSTTQVPTGPSGQPPIIVVHSEDENNGTTIHVKYLDGGRQGPAGGIHISRLVYMASTPPAAMMDDRGNIYILVQDRGTGYNPVLYVVAPDGMVKHIRLKKYSSYVLYSLHDKIMVATTNSVSIIDDPDSPMQTIEFKDIGRNSLVEGRDAEVIVLGTMAVQESGNKLAQAISIDLESGKATEKLLPAPETEDVFPDASGTWPTQPGARYGYTTLIGTSPDLRTLYYVFSEVQEAGDNSFYNAIGAFDIEKQTDLPFVYDECCPPQDGYVQYRDYLMVSHFPEEGGSALLLDTEDLSPVVDWGEVLSGESTSRLSIHPFGDHWIVGTNTRVVLLAQDGSVLEEYPLPSELIGKDYAVVEYRGEAEEEPGPQQLAKPMSTLRRE